MRIFPLTLAGLAVAGLHLAGPIGTAEARPRDDRVADFEQPSPGRPLRPLDRRLVVAAPHDAGWDVGFPDRYVVTLGADLPVRGGAELAACGVLMLGRPGTGRVERLVELFVEPTSPRTELDRMADIGTKPGEMLLHLNPPDLSWVQGWLNVSFECDGNVNAHYPVFVFIPDGGSSVLAEEGGGDTAEELDDEVDADVDAEASAGCSAAGTGTSLPASTAVLVGLAVAAVRRRKTARLVG